MVDKIEATKSVDYTTDELAYTTQQIKNKKQSNTNAFVAYNANPIGNVGAVTLSNGAPNSVMTT